MNTIFLKNIEFYLYKNPFMKPRMRPTRSDADGTASQTAL